MRILILVAFALAMPAIGPSHASGLTIMKNADLSAAKKKVKKKAKPKVEYLKAAPR